MPENRVLTLTRLMAGLLERDGSIDAVLENRFLRVLWKNSRAEDRARVLARQAWRARESVVRASRTRAAYHLTRQLRQDALQHTEGAPFTVAPADLSDDLTTQLEAAVLLMWASWDLAEDVA
ncbi:hypothetical protein FM076_14640 [Streptomyces albus subsp. chlorinus]|uniref:hypothetical protein n=1 Tax=Streptomyces albus TaxID=1888 RepID=UPI00156D7976|nr:hypothetical protein [Streptomyces albus]NSC22356.1 hypothetical protein [Streptomyces albus subsp. chlorinus]